MKFLRHSLLLVFALAFMVLAPAPYHSISYAQGEVGYNPADYDKPPPTQRARRATSNERWDNAG